MASSTFEITRTTRGELEKEGMMCEALHLDRQLVTEGYRREGEIR